MVNENSLTEEQNVVARSIARREFEWKANGTYEIMRIENLPQTTCWQLYT